MQEIVEILDLETPPVPSELYSPRAAWYTFIVFEIQLLAVGIDIAIVALLVHPIEVALRTNDVGFAAITAAPLAIGGSVAAYPAGLLTDMFRRRDLVAVGALFWAIAALIAARADSTAMLFWARFFVGVGSVVPGPPIFSILTDAFVRERRPFMMGLYSATAAIGGGIGLTICGGLVDATRRIGTIHLYGMTFSPWQECFIVIAIVGFFIAALVMTVQEPPRSERVSNAPSVSFASSLRIFQAYLRRNGLLWGVLLLGYSTCLTSLAGLGSWVPAFGQRHFGISGGSSIALLGMFIACGSLLGSITGGVLAKRGINHRDPRTLTRLLAIVSLIALVVCVIFPFLPSWALVAAGVGLAHAAFMIVFLLIQIGMQETAPNEVRGQLNGLWGIIGGIPGLVGPVLVAFFASGLFAKAGGLGPAIALVCGIAGVLAVPLFACMGNLYARARNELHPELSSLSEAS